MRDIFKINTYGTLICNTTKRDCKVNEKKNTTDQREKDMKQNAFVLKLG